MENIDKKSVGNKKERHASSTFFCLFPNETWQRRFGHHCFRKINSKKPKELLSHEKLNGCKFMRARPVQMKSMHWYCKSHSVSESVFITAPLGFLMQKQTSVRSVRLAHGSFMDPVKAQLPQNVKSHTHRWKLQSAIQPVKPHSLIFQAVLQLCTHTRTHTHWKLSDVLNISLWPVLRNKSN